MSLGPYAVLLGSYVPHHSHIRNVIIDVIMLLADRSAVFTNILLSINLSYMLIVVVSSSIIVIVCTVCRID